LTSFQPSGGIACKNLRSPPFLHSLEHIDRYIFDLFEAKPWNFNAKQPVMSPTTPARISDCELVNIERNDFNDMMGPLWDALAQREPAFEVWYRRHSSLVNSSPPSPPRVIAWKSNAPFKPENLFFHTVDTGRLLPMSAAEFRIQYWAHKALWNRVKSKEDLTISMTCMIVGFPNFELLLGSSN